MKSESTARGTPDEVAEEAPGIEVIDEQGKTFVDAVESSIGLYSWQTIDTGDDFESERQQGDSGNNAVALGPGVVITYDRNMLTNILLRKAGAEVITVVDGARPGPRRCARYDVPDRPRPGIVG